MAFRRWLELKQRDMEAVAHVVALLRESHWGDELKRILKDLKGHVNRILRRTCVYIYHIRDIISIYCIFYRV